MFRELVLAAADIDVDEFNEHAADVLSMAQRTTLYASSKDNALAASSYFWGDRQRLGETVPEPVIVDGADTVDVSYVSQGHSYVSDSGRVLEDLIAVIRHGRDAGAARGLIEQKRGPSRYWIADPSTESGGY